ncbi:MAG: hypothetical protein WCL11_19790 [Verrucomicrobiota bacterium]|nr:hypothetical protein [Verrucomicrobiota bacterium]
MRPEGILVAFLWLLLSTAALTVIAALAVALRPLGKGLTASFSPAKAMLFSGCLLLVLCGLFPPWVYIFSGQAVGSAGFHFLFTPPVAIQGEVKLDMNQLAIEWICVLVSTTAVWMLLGKSHQEQG